MIRLQTSCRVLGTHHHPLAHIEFVLWALGRGTASTLPHAALAGVAGGGAAAAATAALALAPALAPAFAPTLAFAFAFRLGADPGRIRRGPC